MDKLKKDIECYKILCRIAGVPEFLIEHPRMVKTAKPSKSDIEWAKKAIKKYNNGK